MKQALAISLLLHLGWLALPTTTPEIQWRKPVILSSLRGANILGLVQRSGPAPGSAAPRNDGAVPMKKVVEWGNTEPEYPVEAQRNGWEGEVLLRLSLQQGNVTGVEIEKSSGYRALDDSARMAALSWKFPESLGEEARIPIEFQLTD